MKRLLIAIAALALLSANAADITTNSNAKVDPKNNKVSNPVVAKPKEAVMSRDALRACMDLRDANEAESKALVTDFANYKSSNEKLKVEKAELEKATEALNGRVTATKAEYDAIMKANEEFKAAAPKMEKADFEAKKKELTDRTNAFTAGRDAVVADNKALNERKNAFADAVDKSNEWGKSLEDRRDAQLDKQDDYKTQCLNKKYDEADEAAIKKERAAKAAAAAAAASAPK